MRAFWKGTSREESDWQGRKAQQVIACKALGDLLLAREAVGEGNKTAFD
jgi:hypothetical protein